MRMYAITLFMHIMGASALLIGLILINISIWRMPYATSGAQLRTWVGLARACYVLSTMKVIKRLSISIAKAKKCTPANVSGNRS